MTPKYKALLEKHERFGKSHVRVGEDVQTAVDEVGHRDYMIRCLHAEIAYWRGRAVDAEGKLRDV